MPFPSLLPSSYLKVPNVLVSRLKSINYRLSFTALGFKKPPKPATCIGALGLENNRIPDNHLSASSHSSSYTSNHARLNHHTHNGFYGGWLAYSNNQYQFLQVNFGQWTKVTGIATQGRSDAAQWVTLYTLGYSFDGVSFDQYKQNHREKVRND